MMRMVARLEKTEQGYAVLLTNEMVESMDLHEGSSVQVIPLAEPAGDQRSAEIHYLTVEEGMKIHREMEPFHAEAYRELAK